jgi:hypothetical protein
VRSRKSPAFSVSYLKARWRLRFLTAATMPAKPHPTNPSVPGSGTVEATNLPSVNTKPAGNSSGNSSEAPTKVHVEQNFPPVGICRIKVVNSSPDPAVPVNESGIAAGWQPLKVAPTVAFTGKVNPPNVVSSRKGVRSSVSSVRTCPPIYTLFSPRNI